MTDESMTIDEEIARVWAEEAERRDQAMESADDPGIPAEKVLRKLRASLSSPAGAQA